MAYLKTLLTYNMPSEAEVDKAFLESRGIAVCLLNANTSRNELGAPFYVQLQVNAEDLERARRRDRHADQAGVCQVCLSRRSRRDHRGPSDLFSDPEPGPSAHDLQAPVHGRVGRPGRAGDCDRHPGKRRRGRLGQPTEGQGAGTSAGRRIGPAGMATRTLLGFAPDLWSCPGGRGCRRPPSMTGVSLSSRARAPGASSRPGRSAGAIIPVGRPNRSCPGNSEMPSPTKDAIWMREGRSVTLGDLRGYKGRILPHETPHRHSPLGHPDGRVLAARAPFRFSVADRLAAFDPVPLHGRGPGGDDRLRRGNLVPSRPPGRLPASLGFRHSP